MVIHALSEMTMPTLPFVGQVKHWQMVFFLVGLPGLLLTLLMMTVPEPVRRKPPPGRRGGLQAEFRHRAALSHRQLALLPADVPGAGDLGDRERAGSRCGGRPSSSAPMGWTPQQAGLVDRHLAARRRADRAVPRAWLSERYARRRDDANLRVVAIAWALGDPAAVAGPLMPTGELSVACGVFSTLFAMMGTPTQNAALQSVTPGAHARADHGALPAHLHAGRRRASARASSPR
ncbi:MAG: hypothetical protein WDN24_06255 [Sphingomonas sp.]